LTQASAGTAQLLQQLSNPGNDRDKSSAVCWAHLYTTQGCWMLASAVGKAEVEQALSPFTPGKKR